MSKYINTKDVAQEEQTVPFPEANEHHYTKEYREKPMEDYNPAAGAVNCPCCSREEKIIDEHLEEINQEIFDVSQIVSMAHHKGYIKGYEEGKKKAVKIEDDREKDIEKDAYARGLHDAWEAARKITLFEEDGGYNQNKINVWFSRSGYYVLKEMNASEVVRSLKRLEQDKEDLRVGDEVVEKGDNRKGVIVSQENNIWYTVLFCDGAHCFISNDNLKKTGRHFDQMVEIIKQMQEAE